MRNLEKFKFAFYLSSEPLFISACDPHVMDFLVHKPFVVYIQCLLERLSCITIPKLYIRS
jgi:hypothetical protein